MIPLRESPEGVTLNVKVKPKAHVNSIVGTRQDMLLIAVTAAPEHHQANRACVAVLAEALGITKSQIEIVLGQTRRDKVVRIRGLSAAEIHRCLNL